MRRATPVKAYNIIKDKDFYPRSPCGERPICKGQIIPIIEFLSTLSLRRATDEIPYQGQVDQFLSTLSLRRATRGQLLYLGEYQFLSTLSLRRATREPTALRTPHHRFLSTLSLRRATANAVDQILPGHDFYPRSPCGERQTYSWHFAGVSKFLSTLSLRRATWANFSGFYWWVISIHALLAESDTKPKALKSRLCVFLSTLSLRRATPMTLRHCTTYLFLSTLSLRRATKFEMICQE